MQQNQSQPRPLRRSEACNYLYEKYGIQRKPQTLAKLAVTGGGPSYVKANRVPLYPPQSLDTWAASIMSPLMTSTSGSVEAA